MRIPVVALSMLAASAPLLAQEAEHAPAGSGGLLTPQAGLMFWTLLIFIVLLVILTRFAFKPLTAAVEARERALQEAIDAARRDREEAARVLDEQRRGIEAARAEAQHVIAEGRKVGEKMRAELLEQARREQQEMLDHARAELLVERDRAIAELRREAVDLALKSASKVIEKNLDDQTNRKLVESYLSSLTAPGAR